MCNKTIFGLIFGVQCNAQFKRYFSVVVMNAFDCEEVIKFLFLFFFALYAVPGNANKVF